MHRFESNIKPMIKDEIEGQTRWYRDSSERLIKIFRVNWLKFPFQNHFDVSLNKLVLRWTENKKKHCRKNKNVIFLLLWKIFDADWSMKSKFHFFLMEPMVKKPLIQLHKDLDVHSSIFPTPDRFLEQSEWKSSFFDDWKCSFSFYFY